MILLQERSSSVLSSTSFESFTKPASGVMGDRMSAMKQAFQVNINPCTYQHMMMSVLFVKDLLFSGIVICSSTSPLLSGSV